MNIFSLFRNREKPLKISVLGAGSWGTTIAKILGENVINNFLFDNNVYLYCRNEELKCEIMNYHINKKYLDNILLPNNLICGTDLMNIFNESNIVFFGIPFPFLIDVVKQMDVGSGKGKIGVLLTKGFYCHEGQYISLCQFIKEWLGIEMVVLSGANVCGLIAINQYASTTIGCMNEDVGKLIKELLTTSYFNIDIVRDVGTVELFGSIKNIIALAAGVVDGLGMGENTKAEIIRQGCIEMIRLTKYVFSEQNNKYTEIFMQNCGISDIIASCYGGRNRMCAEEFVKGKEKNIEQIEQKLLNGQKLQGVETLKSVVGFIEKNNLGDKFPLFIKIHKIIFNKSNDVNLF